MNSLSQMVQQIGTGQIEPNTFGVALLDGEVAVPVVEHEDSPDPSPVLTKVPVNGEPVEFMVVFTEAEMAQTEVSGVATDIRVMTGQELVQLVPESLSLLVCAPDGSLSIDQPTLRLLQQEVAQRVRAAGAERD